MPRPRPRGPACWPQSARAGPRWWPLPPAVQRCGRARPGAPGEREPNLPATGSRRIRRSVVHTLPRRFVVVAEQGSGDAATISRATGSVIPDEFRGSVEGEAIDPERGRLLAGDSRWLVDYQAAKDVGLGIDLTLERPGVTIDRLIAYGVRARPRPEAPPRHARRVGGLAVELRRPGRCRSGTPTNDTEAVTSGRDSTVPPPPPLAAAPPGEGRQSQNWNQPSGCRRGYWPNSSAGGYQVPRLGDPRQLRWRQCSAGHLGGLPPAPGGRSPPGTGRLLPEAASLEALRRHATDTVRGLGPRRPFGWASSPTECCRSRARTPATPAMAPLAEGALTSFLEGIRPLAETAAELPTVAAADLETALPDTRHAAGQ